MPVPRDFFMRVVWNGATSSVSEARSICPHCKTATTLNTRSHYGQTSGAKKIELHLVFECNNAPCKRLFYIQTLIVQQHQVLDRNEEFYMYPSGAIDAHHPGIPVAVADDWEEAQKVMQAGASKGAAVMFRRVLYGVLLDRGCKLRPIRDGLQELITENRLPAIFDDWLPAIKDDGHDGAHPDRALQVSAENIEETRDYTAELLRYLYVEPYEFQKRKLRNSAAASPAPPQP